MDKEKKDTLKVETEKLRLENISLKKQISNLRAT